jgi:hypothetical protein
MSLRLVCKEIYVNTTYDAGIRYGGDLRCLNIDLRYNSLTWLLHMCSIPAFRDKIEVIHLRHPSFRDSVDDDGPIFLRCSEYEDHLCNEDIKFYVDSSEAVHLLSACFRELRKDSPLLRKISIMNREANPLVFAALELARFDSKLVTVFIDPHDVRNDSCFTRPMFVSSRLIKAVTFTTEVHEDQSGKLNFRNTNRKLDMVQNAKGRHYRHYEPAGPALSNLVARLGNVEHMVLQGCEYGPRLRFCQEKRQSSCHNSCTTHLLSSYLPKARQHLRQWQSSSWRHQEARSHAPAGETLFRLPNRQHMALDRSRSAQVPPT